MLESISDGEEAGRFLAAIADTVLARLVPLVEADFAAKHGTIPDGAFGVLAFGRLGGKVMSFSSTSTWSRSIPHRRIGERGLEAPNYYIRLTQRLIAAITAPMADGKLYDVDLRLRPSGEAGPVAVALSAFRQYQAASAWTLGTYGADPRPTDRWAAGADGGHRRRDPRYADHGARLGKAAGGRNRHAPAHRRTAPPR